MLNTKYNINNLISKLLIAFVFTFCHLKAQNIIDIDLKKKAGKFSKDTDFYKAAVFFLNKQNDSLLIYSTRLLEGNDLNPDIKYYCHYFRGVVFSQKRMFEEAENEFLKIPANFVCYPKTVALLGDIALEQNDFKKAVSYYLNPQITNQYKNFGIDKSHIVHNIGLCYLHLGEFNKAEKFLFEGLQLHIKKKDTAMIIGSYMDIGGLYYEQYMDNKAISYYEKAYSLSKNAKDYVIKKNAALNMAVIEENRKNYLKSLGYRKESEVWNDSLNNQTKIWYDAQREKQLAVKSKQNEVNILQAENKVKTLEKNRILYIVIILIIIIIGGIYLYLQKIKINKVILKQKISLDQSNATKDMLFSVISHDLRSYISSVKRMHSIMLVTSENHNVKKLNEQIKISSSIVDSTHSLLNNLLHWALLQTDQLYFHQETINIYQITEQVAYNYKALMDEKNILFENTIPENTNVFADQESLKIIIRNLLDNAIKFTEPGGKVSIYETKVSDNYHAITIEDTGIGMSKESLNEVANNRRKITNEKSNKSSTGLGLQLCKLMTEKNSGSLDLKSEKNSGTRITVSLLKG